MPSFICPETHRIFVPPLYHQKRFQKVFDGVLLPVNFAQEHFSTLQLNCPHCSMWRGSLLQDHRLYLWEISGSVFHGSHGCFRHHPFLYILQEPVHCVLYFIVEIFHSPNAPPFSLFVGFKMFLDSMWSFFILPDNFIYAHCPQKCQKTPRDYIQMITAKLPIMSGGKNFMLPNIYTNRKCAIQVQFSEKFRLIPTSMWFLYKHTTPGRKRSKIMGGAHCFILNSLIIREQDKEFQIFQIFEIFCNIPKHCKVKRKENKVHRAKDRKWRKKDKWERIENARNKKK